VIRRNKSIENNKIMIKKTKDTDKHHLLQILNTKIYKGATQPKTRVDSGAPEW